MALKYTTATAALIFAWVAYRAWKLLYNAYFHPLAKFAGPRGVSTGWFRICREVFAGENWPDVLKELHQEYGEVVRVEVNELHFSNPDVYHELYNNSNKWDKEKTLYHSFGEDRSSFGLLHYRDSKRRKDAIGPCFSKRAISDLQGMVRKNIDRICDSLAKEYEAGKSSDMLFAMRCFTLDTIVMYCFAQDLECYAAPDFQSPFVVAMDASLLTFLLFKHSHTLKNFIFAMPGWLSKTVTPMLTGLVDLQELLGRQVQEVVKNPESLEKMEHPVIYQRMMDPALHLDTGLPTPDILYEEAQTQVSAGADTVGNTLMYAIYQIQQRPSVVQKLKQELRDIWPNLSEPPSLEELEKLSYLGAVVKEALRTGHGVPGPLPRVVPQTGATLGGKYIPGGSIVGMSYLFVHQSPEVFNDPTTFEPERWLQPESTALQKYLLLFSTGPRSCLGQNLAMCELYFAVATLYRRFDFEIDGGEVDYRDCFVPRFNPNHVRAFCKPVEK